MDIVASHRSKELPRGWIYAGSGLLLGLAAPVGLLLLRAALAARAPSFDWVLAEMAHDALAYAYLTALVCGSLVPFGWLAGRTVDRLRAESTTDPLTGLANRREFDRRLRQELARKERHGQPLSVLAIDVDDLKRLNDRHGHGAGDSALRGLAACLRRTCRTTDLSARLGGDEFAVVAPYTTAVQAAELAQRLRDRLERQAAGRASPPGSFTVSIGIAESSSVATPFAPSVMQGADRALYRAKMAGRDRTVVAPTSLDLTLPTALPGRGWSRHDDEVGHRQGQPARQRTIARSLSGSTIAERVDVPLEYGTPRAHRRMVRPRS